MEKLKTERLTLPGEEFKQFSIQEKDFGDQLSYDFYHDGIYLGSFAADGTLLFMDWDAIGKNRLQLNKELIEKVQQFIKKLA